MELGLPKLAVPRLGLAAFRRRIIFRGTFLFLVVATLAFALVLLRAEKERSYAAYEQGFRKTQAEIVAKLRHPSGQLALLNPATRAGAVTPLKPLVLPYGALDFDDQNKVQQAVEMAGCSVQYRDGSSACVAIGNNPYTGGFIYLVGSFAAGELSSRSRGALDLSEVHRARVTLTLRGETTRWIAPFERLAEPQAVLVRGRLTGFVETGPALAASARPVRDFRGWLWQTGECAAAADDPQTCPKRAFFSIRLPVDVFREALYRRPRPAWPPPDLDKTEVRVEMFAPGSDEPIFDSNAEGARPPFSLEDLTATLLPGETLRIRKIGTPAQDAITVQGREDASGTPSRWLARLIGRLPVGEYATPTGRDVIATPIGSYELVLTGDPGALDRNLGVVATRLSWFVAAMLLAIALAWLVIEIGLIRRITVLTKRAASVSYNVRDPQIDRRIGELDVSDLRGKDELGILADGLSTLLQRVKDDVRREHIRAQQERDMWHAVGHEIMSPLQSLMVLHGGADDPSHRYVQRMQQAVRVLYGTASPSEALEAVSLDLRAVDLDAFLRNVAANARFAGIEDVRYESAGRPAQARADEYSLEDVVTHILRNADRHRTPGTPITLALAVADSTVNVTIGNSGAPIDPAMIERIFEYGVSDAGEAHDTEHRGQGLFVARTYMAKMGGTVTVRNADAGVAFSLTLQRA